MPVAWDGGRAPCIVRRLCASSCLCSRTARCSPNSQSSTTAVRSTRLPWRPLVCPTLLLHVAVCSLCSARTSAPTKARRCRSLSLQRWAEFRSVSRRMALPPRPFRSSSRLRRSTRCPRYPIREHLGDIPGDAQWGDLPGPGLLNFRMPIHAAGVTSVRPGVQPETSFSLRPYAFARNSSPSPSARNRRRIRRPQPRRDSARVYNRGFKGKLPEIGCRHTRWGMVCPGASQSLLYFQPLGMVG